MTAAAGWYPDPQTTGSLRFWDGLQWTEHVAAAAPEPAMAGYSQAGAPPAAHGQTAAWGYVPDRSDHAAAPAPARFEGAPCQACGAGPSRVVKFNRLRGLFILFVASTRPGRWCRDCAVGPFRESQNFTLAWGWWGLFTLFLTPIALLLNLRQLHLARSLPAPVGRLGPVLPAGKPLGERLGLWVALVLLPLIILIVVVRGQ